MSRNLSAPTEGASSGLPDEAPEPIRENGAGNGPPPKVCRGCRSENPADANQCRKCGKVLAANQLAVKDYRFAKVKPAEIVMNSDEMLAGLVADKGGANAMSTLQRSLAAKMRDVDILLALNKRTVINEGVDSPTGRRAHDRYLASLDRFIRIAGVLGLERAARRVTSPLDFIEGKG